MSCVFFNYYFYIEFSVACWDHKLGSKIKHRVPTWPNNYSTKEKENWTISDLVSHVESTKLVQNLNAVSHVVLLFWESTQQNFVSHVVLLFFFKKKKKKLVHFRLLNAKIMSSYLFIRPYRIKVDWCGWNLKDINWIAFKNLGIKNELFKI